MPACAKRTEPSSGSSASCPNRRLRGPARRPSRRPCGGQPEHAPSDVPPRPCHRKCSLRATTSSFPPPLFFFLLAFYFCSLSPHYVVVVCRFPCCRSGDGTCRQVDDRRRCRRTRRGPRRRRAAAEKSVCVNRLCPADRSRERRRVCRPLAAERTEGSFLFDACVRVVLHF